MGKLRFATRDFRNMTEEEQNKVFVHKGNLSMLRLYQYLYGSCDPPTHDQIKRLRCATERAQNGLSRCQIDLLQIEFGIDTVPISKAIVNDAIITDPPEANTKKLQKAIEKIEACYKAS